MHNTMHIIPQFVECDVILQWQSVKKCDTLATVNEVVIKYSGNKWKNDQVHCGDQ